MALYAFQPISLPAPPPAAPGTDFQDFAAANLPDPDPADELVSSLLSGAQGGLNDALTDMAGLNDDLNSAILTLQAIITDTETEDFTEDILDAIAADAEFSSLDDSAGADIANFIPGLSDLLDSWFGFALQDWIGQAEQDMIIYMDNVISAALQNFYLGEFD